MLGEVYFEDVGVALGPKGETYGRFCGEAIVENGIITELWLEEVESRYDRAADKITRTKRILKLEPHTWLHKALLEDVMARYGAEINAIAEPDPDETRERVRVSPPRGRVGNAQAHARF